MGLRHMAIHAMLANPHIAPFELVKQPSFRQDWCLIDHMMAIHTQCLRPAVARASNYENGERDLMRGLRNAPLGVRRAWCARLPATAGATVVRELKRKENKFRILCDLRREDDVSLSDTCERHDTFMGLHESYVMQGLRNEEFPFVVSEYLYTGGVRGLICIEFLERFLASVTKTMMDVLWAQKEKDSMSCLETISDSSGARESHSERFARGFVRLSIAYANNSVREVAMLSSAAQAGRHLRINRNGMQNVLLRNDSEAFDQEECDKLQATRHVHRDPEDNSS
ncbi:hypothetical protein CRENBAI_004457 [Crenichthys baileyi]|uniref:Uncharacterized protein n=1 Tax=Crenichthys baileyi TaxID=28760 RepID=A0AAV9RKM4_9TELE